MANLDMDLTPQLKIHYATEAKLLRQLLDMEKHFRNYRNFNSCEIVTQKTLIERLWLLSQRYILLGDTEESRFPEIYTLSTEEVIINEFEEKLRVLCESIASMEKCVKNLGVICTNFHETYDTLNLAMETPFIVGDQYHKSIKHFKEMITTIFHYFYSNVLKMWVYAHYLDPLNCESVADYRKILIPSEEFELYLEEFVFCKCLLKKPTCPISKLRCHENKLGTLKFVSRI